MRFFNKARLEQIKASGLRKYMLYATGEIILVVAGILIALWINNWNKEEQIAIANVQLQEKVLTQLDKDINDLDEFLKELDTLDNTYLRVLEREYDKTKVDKKGILSTILFDVKDLSLDKQNSNWIDNAVLHNSQASENLINLSGIYKSYFKDINDMEQIIYKKFTTNLEYLEETQLWYTTLITDLKCENDCINYLLKSEEHKSRIASLRFLYINGYGDLVNSFHDDLIASREELKATMLEEAK
ncbi:hypothetical protein CW736_10795 [Nonlabens sp. MB-3u-79]|uniref:hypothetical protein n=1 Tax=Nonlabens sp. MB-3u-79 TaxID=2058134 RepID=UPI000C31A5DC|nr:hypothetical protein [Nonlabens sp. MB-3u-79]AUC79817.1 hypothetical protein CW736_10795 [Nonlabens sp. MB-3u-79]